MADTGEPAGTGRRWVRWWVGIVAVVSAVGFAVPRMVGDGERSPGTLSAQGLFGATSGVASPTAPAKAPVEAHGCPQWLNGLGLDLPTRPGAGGMLVPDVPRSAVICRYPQLAGPVRRADLVALRPLPDAQGFAARLNRLPIRPGGPKGKISCLGELPAFEYVVLFEIDGGARHGMQISQLCNLALNSELTASFDDTEIEALNRLFA